MSNITAAQDLIVDALRRERQVELNKGVITRENLEAQYGKVWTMDELRPDFEILAFAAPFVVAKRKSDRVKGTFEFTHSPRFYFNWVEDK